MRIIGVTLLALLGLLPALWAGGMEGAAPFNFLFLDGNANPAAMGGAYAAIANPVNSLMYNPGNLASNKNSPKNEATFMHSEHFQGASQEYGALALDLKEGTIGFMINTVSFGKVQRTTISNPRGTGLDSFRIRDWLLSVGYGKRMNDWLSLGIAGKYIQEKIDTEKASAFAVDMGARAELSGYELPLTFGISIQNIGTKPKFQSTREDLPLNLKMGLAWQFLESGILALDLNQPKHGEATIHMGAEYVAFEIVALRIGYNGRNEADSGITAGGGMRLDRFSVDYAFVPFGDLGDSHKMSLSYRWGSR